MELAERIVYANGTFKRYDEARVGLLTHGLQYGTGCFEGVRGFWNDDERELYLLALDEHYSRLAASAHILMIDLPHSVRELGAITAELCARNGFECDVYLRPFCYKAAEDVGVRLHNVPSEFAIVAIPFTKYIDTSSGLKCCVTAWRRIDDTCAPARAKITGIYVNSALAKTEAQLSGFDEAIMLSHDGHIAEGSAENLFLVKNGNIYTPDPAQNILEGVTRREIMMLAREELGLEAIERAIDRSELYSADELFLTGSAAGVVWVQSVDHRRIGGGEIGPVTAKLMQLYGGAVRGKLPKYRGWVTPAYASQRVRAAV